MFTGIIVAKGELLDIENISGDRIMSFEGKINMKDLSLGASLCHNGVCLTIIESKPLENGNSFWKVQVSQETIDKSTFGDLKKADALNLEPSLRIGDELGGHIVSGHVDGVGTIENIEQILDSHKLTIRAPKEMMPYIAKKGSIAIDGISLTVNDVTNELFFINIIPHTWENTNIGSHNIGDKINLEIDPIARYVERWLSFGGKENK